MRLNGEKVEVSRGVPFTHTSPLWYNLILHLFLLLLATKTNAGALEFPQHCCSQPSSNIQTRWSRLENTWAWGGHNKCEM